jgi:hypothetical protein
MHSGLLCASLLWPRPETLHGRVFGNHDGENRDGSIHILKDGTLDQVFGSLEKLLDLELCRYCQAIFGYGPRRFELEAMLTCETN